MKVQTINNQNFEARRLRLPVRKLNLTSPFSSSFFIVARVVLAFSSKEIRHDIYNARQGVVYEGAEELPVGMTLPANSVSIIPPQNM